MLYPGVQYRTKATLLYFLVLLCIACNKTQTDSPFQSNMLCTLTYFLLFKALIGPPTNLKLTIQDNDLHIAVEEPEGFRHEGLRGYCTWMYHLKAWKNSAPTEVSDVLKDIFTFSNMKHPCLGGNMLVRTKHPRDNRWRFLSPAAAVTFKIDEDAWGSTSTVGHSFTDLC